MKRFKGTKGKWFAVEYAGTYMIQDGEMYEDNNILDSDIYTKEVVDANAQLIATAPELLEALIAMIDIVDNTSGVTGWHMNGDIANWEEFRDVDIARDIINKALGYD